VEILGAILVIQKDREDVSVSLIADLLNIQEDRWILDSAWKDLVGRDHRDLLCPLNQFLTDGYRSRSYFVDVAAQHANVASHCVRILVEHFESISTMYVVVPRFHIIYHLIVVADVPHMYNTPLQIGLPTVRLLVPAKAT
jgi:hypothetical protein